MEWEKDGNIEVEIEIEKNTEKVFKKDKTEEECIIWHEQIEHFIRVKIKTKYS